MSKILYETKGSIARITINRPEAMNAFDLETASLMRERLKEFDGDSGLRVAIITGAGDKAFCAGADLKKMHGGSHDGGINELWDFERQNRLGPAAADGQTGDRRHQWLLPGRRARAGVGQ